MSLLISIIAFILILAVLVIVHEFGHFIVAKKSGIRVDEFGFGFPPRAKKLFTKNGTDFTLNWIPFGGFVKIFGENGDEEKKANDSFVSKSKLTQIAVLVAGPLFNVLFAWIALSLMFMIGSPTIYDESYGNSIKNVHVAVVEVFPESPADKAGIVVGDQVLSLSRENGKEKIDVLSTSDITSIFEGRGTEPVTVEVLRKDKVFEVEIAPGYGLYEGQTDPALGVALNKVGTLKLPVHVALWEGLQKTWSLVRDTALFLLDIISNLIHGDSSQTDAITGPVGIVPVVGDAIKIGFSFVIVIMALISVNLAVINLLPFPALDGGRILFILIETIKGSPLNPKITTWFNTIGFLILIGLMILVTIRDVINLF